MKTITLTFSLLFCIVLSVVSNDLKPLKDKHSKKYGYVDKSDNYIIKPKFDKARKFNNGLAQVEIGKMVGIIDEVGEYVVTPKYQKISSFDNSFATVVLNDRIGLINKQGEVIVEPKYDDIDNFEASIAIIELNKMEGLINMKGEEIVPPRYTKINDFSEGKAIVKLHELEGLITLKGEEILQPSFEKIHKFRDGFALVETDEKWGLINSTGIVLIKAQYDEIDMDAPLVYVLSKARYGIIDISGKIIFEPTFIEKPNFNISNTYAIVSQSITSKTQVEQLYGLVSKDGKLPLPCKFSTLVKDENHYFAHIDSSEKWIIYDEAFTPLVSDLDSIVKIQKKYYNEGLCIVCRDGKWGFVNTMGQETIALKYDKIYEDGFKGTYCAVELDGKWGFIGTDGNYLFEPQFTSIVSSFTSISINRSAKVWDHYKKYQIYEDGTKELIEDITPKNE